MTQAMQPGAFGNIIVTDAPADRVRTIIQQAAQYQQFSVTPVGEWSMRLQKGSLLASILLGMFIAYCDFQLHITASPDGNNVVTLVRNRPWWTGIVGIKRTRKRADELGTGIASGIQQSQFQILRHDRT